MVAKKPHPLPVHRFHLRLGLGLGARLHGLRLELRLGSGLWVEGVAGTCAGAENWGAGAETEAGAWAGTEDTQRWLPVMVYGATDQPKLLRKFNFLKS